MLTAADFNDKTRGTFWSDCILCQTSTVIQTDEKKITRCSHGKNKKNSASVTTLRSVHSFIRSNLTLTWFRSVKHIVWYSNRPISRFKSRRHVKYCYLSVPLGGSWVLLMKPTGIQSHHLILVMTSPLVNLLTFFFLFQWQFLRTIKTKSH